VYEEDAVGTSAARGALDEACGRIREKEDEIATLISDTEERIRRVQAPVQPTQILHDEAQPSAVADEAPPEPPQIPEPWPPPDEGDIPEPPRPAPDTVPGPREPEPPLEPPAPGPSSERR
jgi:hypothetical protein